MAEDPGPGQVLDHPSLSRRDGFLTRAEPRRPPDLDLNKRHQRSPPHHQVDIMVAQGKAMGLQAPAAPLQPLRGEQFSLPAIAVAGVGPLIDGNAGGRHGGQDGGRRWPCGDPVNAKRCPGARENIGDRNYYSA